MGSGGSKEKELHKLVREQNGSKEKELEKQVREQHNQIGDLTNRLAAKMTKEVASDESSMEDVSVRNRPMNVASDYGLLCANDWLEAKQDLDENFDSMPEQDKMKLLCKILKVAESKAYEAKNSMPSMIIDELMRPEGPLLTPKLTTTQNKTFVQKDDKTENGGKSKLSQAKEKGQSNAQTSTLNKANIEQLKVDFRTEFEHLMGDILRKTADDICVQFIVEAVCEDLDREYSSPGRSHINWKNMKTQPSLQTYISKAVRVAWKMCIQRPGMIFNQGKTEKVIKYLGDKYHDLAWGSEVKDKKNAEVVEVHPMLYHGDALMSKGKVLLIGVNKSPDQDTRQDSQHDDNKDKGNHKSSDRKDTSDRKLSHSDGKGQDNAVEKGQGNVKVKGQGEEKTGVKGSQHADVKSGGTTAQDNNQGNKTQKKGKDSELDNKSIKSKSKK